MLLFPAVFVIVGFVKTVGFVEISLLFVLVCLLGSGCLFGSVYFFLIDLGSRIRSLLFGLVIVVKCFGFLIGIGI